jgi:hypothetical protein
MQYDVKSSYLDDDGVFVAYRTRLKGLYITVATAGTALVIYDNASAASGNVIITLNTDVVGCHNVTIPGEGILAENGLYLDINGASSVTALYG